MRSGHLLFSAVQFLFTLLIVLIGGFFVGLHYAPHLRLCIANIFIEYSNSFASIGLSILSCGILLLVGFFAMNRGVYFRFLIPSQQNAVIEAALFRTCIKKYFTSQFPESNLSIDVILHRDQKIEISLEMPLKQIEDHDLFLQTTEKDLRLLLSKTLGYRNDFLLTILVK